MLSSVKYYYYDTLDEGEQEVYRTILDGLLREDSEIPVGIIDEDELKSIIAMVINDHPELFWFDQEYQYMIYDRYTIVVPRYTCLGEEKRQRQEVLDGTVEQILSGINTQESECEKIKAVFQYLIDHVDTTFGDRAFDSEDVISSIPKNAYYNYDYLCCSDADMYRDREADEIERLPVCSSNQLNYYVLKGTYFETYSDNVLRSMQDSILAGECFWSCKFSEEMEYREFLNDMEDGLYGQRVLRKGTYNQIDTWYTGNDSMYTVTCWYEGQI